MPSAQMRMFFENMGQQGLMLTYDDVRLRTMHSDVLPTQTDISSRLTSNILLKMPIVSSPMDTVTTGPMAVAMAENGGAGSIYRMKDVHEQARHVRRAKFSLNGLIQTPITVQHDEIIADVVKMREQKGYKFETFPVLNESGKVCGLVSGSDFDFCEDHNAQMSSIMTDGNLLVSASSNTTKREAYDIMRKNKKKVLLLIDDGELRGMYIYSDLVRTFANGGAMYNIDKNGQLIVGAAVGAGPAAIERATALAEKNVDYFQIDTAHGDSGNVIWTIKELKRLFPHIDVLAGNVSSGRGAVALAKAGADGILVGQGPGSICTTRVIAGVGVPQVSAIYECVTALELAGYGHVPVCADGGINNSGDIVIALAVGASSVMLGRLLAGTQESPGETRLYNGAQVKDYRGMGSFGAMRDNAASRERYGQAAVSLNKVVPEGIEGIVPFRGPVAGVLNHHTGGLRSGLGYNGCRTIQELQAHAEIFRITNAGLSESHPHDITITAEAPNYHR